MKKLTYFQKVMVGMFLIVFTAFIVSTAFFVSNSIDDVSVSDDAVQRELLTQLYIDGTSNQPIRSSFLTNQSNIIEYATAVNLTSGSRYYSINSTFEFRPSAGLFVDEGVGYLDTENSVVVYFADRNVLVLNDSKVFIDARDQSVKVIEGGAISKENQLAESGEQLVYLVDIFYVRDFDLNETVEDAALRDIAYFLFDTANLPEILDFARPGV